VLDQHQQRGIAGVDAHDDRAPAPAGAARGRVAPRATWAARRTVGAAGRGGRVAAVRTPTSIPTSSPIAAASAVTADRAQHDAAVLTGVPRLIDRLPRPVRRHRRPAHRDHPIARRRQRQPDLTRVLPDLRRPRVPPRLPSTSGLPRPARRVPPLPVASMLSGLAGEPRHVERQQRLVIARGLADGRMRLAVGVPGRGQVAIWSPLTSSLVTGAMILVTLDT
jgi:hypothetical protein